MDNDITVFFTNQEEESSPHNFVFRDQSMLHSNRNQKKLISDKKLHFATFENISFLNLKFLNCTFKHCKYDNLYAREVTFENVDFTGTFFVNCNFDNIKLINCNIRHCRFQNCIIPVNEIINSLPPESNLKKKLATNLKVNFQNLGIQNESDKFLDIEIKAEIGNLNSIIISDSDYYKMNFQTFDRIIAVLKLCLLRFEIFVWGYGHKVKNLLISYTVILLVYSLLMTLLQIKFSNNSQEVPQPINFFDALRLSFATSVNFSNIAFKPTDTKGEIFLTLISFTGILYMGLLSATFYRKISK
ncbi:pentapeptide repeat-containing protein [Lacihabitans sp. CS3-21]|uniref:pentapeptide repeat-containing protein n=1 Tax=Lacihabitans sp. CS3-21 TaxID=2487332 RepID=UPI0020CF64DA|nr:pentapeptide repeat-containing protein [Lacihabitans sp. CS3-21]MCP9748935.1 hypothetical protein [Lacihabitans sp. CS3-21]